MDSSNAGILAATAAAAAAVAASTTTEYHTHPRYVQNQSTATNSSTSDSKPAVGSDEWLKQRRESHKEVERRRREAINEGITELAKIVPDGEKNKGRVIQRAVQYINQLKQSEAMQLEKWTLEKLLCEQAIQELHNNVDKLRAENDKLRAENDKLKRELKRNDVENSNVRKRLRGEETGSPVS
ncbi:basic helix-loop-helix protein [Dinochytrium kinnereticum]|nr:basic helix-loop-helix protein [Dinochytrium kinnereticum]